MQGCRRTSGPSSFRLRRGVTWFLHRYAAIDLRYYASGRVGSEPEEATEAEYVELPDIENHFVVSISVGY
jgi:hypothetical protein